MVYAPPELYWFCIPPLEKITLLAAVASFVSSPVFMLKEALDAVWFGAGGTIDDERYLTFVAEEGLTLAEITVDDVELTAYLFDTTYYTLLVAFLASDPEPDDPPCYLSRNTVY